eukprot:gene14244-biopygen6566
MWTLTESIFCNKQKRARTNWATAVNTMCCCLFDRAKLQQQTGVVSSPPPPLRGGSVECRLGGWEAAPAVADSELGG